MLKIDDPAIDFLRSLAARIGDTGGRVLNEVVDDIGLIERCDISQKAYIAEGASTRLGTIDGLSEGDAAKVKEIAHSLSCDAIAYAEIYDDSRGIGIFSKPF